MTNTGPDEQAIFHATRRMAEPEARRLYLDQACGDDRELRAHVEALLKVHDDDRSFLESRVEKVRASIPDPTSDGPGTIIGPYRLIEQLGEGGMGTVYLAEQTEPVRRQVALKIVRSGMD